MWREDKSLVTCEVDTLTAGVAEAGRKVSSPPRIPEYLTKHYSWAYVTPEAVKRFERPLIIDMILWGNYAKLSGAVIEALKGVRTRRALQIACAYGDFSPRLAERVADGGGRLDVIDVLPVQLDNLQSKLAPDAPVDLHQMDSGALAFEDETFDVVVLFLLLHEQPEAWRRRTLSEAWRVVKRGGRIVLVDYAKPAWWNPLRYIMAPVLTLLEPFAMDLWRRPIRDYTPAGAYGSLTRETACGGLYQILTTQKD
jgi:ubiquinone/menaquinone biosynthesis C-methylase UbiE